MGSDKADHAATPVTQTPREIPGVPVPLIPAFATGPNGGILELFEADGTQLPTCRPVTVPAGSIVVIIPPPASMHLAQAMGITGAQGRVIVTPPRRPS